MEVQQQIRVQLIRPVDGPLVFWLARTDLRDSRR